MEGAGALTYDFQQGRDGRARLVLKGRLDRDAAARIWKLGTQRVLEAQPASLVVEAGELEYCDGAGVAWLWRLKQIQQDHGGQFEIRDLRPAFERLLALFEPHHLVSPPPRPWRVASFVRALGETTVRLVHGFHAQVDFTGEVVAKLLSGLRHPHTLRWREILVTADKAGANAVGITALLGFLIGLIIAFQSAVAMEEFGAQIFVADLVVIALFRELGPLITAFILASRSGSAFAAEIGTMKVNEEIDALTTMALDPVQYLVLPRVIAATCIMPLLTMFNLLFGLIGCGLVMASWHIPVHTFMDRIREAASLSDFFSGMAKTFVFGALIAGIGCLRGLQTGSSPSAVGDSATRAVVSGIVAIVVADGVFAVVYYFLGI
jgi:phospholipid/cholesterol/gamma-HCH transport system permease protein